MSTVYMGVDVSDNQKVINWKQVANDGCQFAILRSVRHSGKTDYQFTANLAGCRANNVPVAVYKYTYAKTVAEAEKEAEQVVELLKQHSLICKVFWDVEDSDYLKPLGRSKLTEVVKAAEKVITAAGLEFCLYVGLYVYKENWFDFAQFDCPLWVARYPLKGEKTLKDFPADKYKPEVGRAIYGWQFTAEGKVDGISTGVDLDVLYADPLTLGGTPVADKEGDKDYIFATSKISKNKAEQLLNKAKQMDVSGSLYRIV